MRRRPFCRPFVHFVPARAHRAPVVCAWFVVSRSTIARWYAISSNKSEAMGCCASSTDSAGGEPPADGTKSAYSTVQSSAPHSHDSLKVHTAQNRNAWARRRLLYANSPSQAPVQGPADDFAPEEDDVPDARFPALEERAARASVTAAALRRLSDAGDNDSSSADRRDRLSDESDDEESRLPGYPGEA
jgi:hypothetical protein